MRTKKIKHSCYHAIHHKSVRATTFDNTINGPVLCGLCNKPVWLLNLKNHHDEKHAGVKPTATDNANLEKQQEIVNTAEEKLTKELKKKTRRK